MSLNVLQMPVALYPTGLPHIQIQNIIFPLYRTLVLSAVFEPVSCVMELEMNRPSAEEQKGHSLM